MIAAATARAASISEGVSPTTQTDASGPSLCRTSSTPWAKISVRDSRGQANDPSGNMDLSLVFSSFNLEPIGWLKLEKTRLRSMFPLGSFAWPRESRTEIFAHGVELVRQRLGPDASVCVVGDTPSDIEAARAVAAAIIVLSTGVYPFSQLAAEAPDACLAGAADLLSLP